MGRIVGAFGLQGWVKVKAFTEEAGGAGAFPRWLVHAKEGWREMALEGFEVHARGPVAKLAGCGDRDAAERLRGADVAVPRSELGDAGEGAYYRSDLVGLAVVDEGGSTLGEVESFFDTGPTSVMVVKGERERMIPFVPEYVKAVDPVARRITVDWKADYDA